MKVKIDTGATASEIAVGKRIAAGVAGIHTTPNGIVERLGGVVSGESLEAGGSGYKASLSGQTASTFNVTGGGTGLTLDVSSGSDGVVTGAAINAAGSGYSVGDLVGIVTSTLGAGQQSGSGALFSIDSISATDTLYLTNVQGENFYFIDKAHPVVELLRCMCTSQPPPTTTRPQRTRMQCTRRTMPRFGRHTPGRMQTT